VLSLGAVGGVLGALLAAGLVRLLGAAVFGAALEPDAALAPLAVAGALLVAALGAVFPIRRALALDPAPELKEGA
jgi:putative ABC transport system permease protein